MARKKTQQSNEAVQQTGPEPDDGSDRNTPRQASGYGLSATGVVDLEALLSEINAKLVTVGSVPLARPQPAQVERIEQMQILVFVLGDALYGIETVHIGEIMRGTEIDITPVPGLPGWVLGVTNLHGDVVSVIDLPRFLEIEAPATRRTINVLVTQAADQRIGLLVDDIELIHTFPVDQVFSPPFKVEPELVAYLRGAIEREGEFIRLLDCERLLLGPQMQQFS